MKLEPADLIDLASVRAGEFRADHDRMTRLESIFNGGHKDLFPREFRADELEKIAGFIRRSWKMFATHVGKVPDVRVAPLALGDRAQKRADGQEKICFCYNDVWGMRYAMNRIAWYQVGFGVFAAGIFPDVRSGYPMLLVEDPRHVLPGPGWQSTSTWSGDWYAPAWSGSSPLASVGGQLDDVIVRKTMTSQQIAKLFPGRLDMRGSKSARLTDRHVVLMHYDDTHINVTTDGGVPLATVEHGAPWCPWVYGTTFNPARPGGSSDFEQQIGLEIAFMRVLDQMLALNDSVAWPWLVTKGLVDVDPEKRHIKLGSLDANAAFMSPPGTMKAQQDLALLRDLLRTFNFETEASQGDVQGGPITGRGLIELSRVTVDTVQAFFDDLSMYLPRLYTTALLIDRDVFGAMRKPLAGWGKGEAFHTEYTPSRDIGERLGRVTVEFGPGLGGFEGHLQMLQDVGAEAISVRTVMEKNPHILSISTEQRLIFLEKLDRLLEAALRGELAVPFDWLAALGAAVEEGADWREWVTQNPPPQATAMPGGVPPIPPELAAAAGLGGGQAPLEEELLREGQERLSPPSVAALMGVA